MKNTKMMCDQCHSTLFVMTMDTDPPDSEEWVSNMRVNCKDCGKLTTKLSHMKDGRMCLNDRIYFEI